MCKQKTFSKIIIKLKIYNTRKILLNNIRQNKFKKNN